MSEPGSTPEPPSGGSGDPWAAFGHVVAGVALYGVIGWLLDRWLHTAFLLPMGIVAGAAFGIYVTFLHHRQAFAPRSDNRSTVIRSNSGAAPQKVNRDRPRGPTSTSTPSSATGPGAGATDDTPREETA